MTKRIFILLVGLSCFLYAGCQKEKPAPVLHEQGKPEIPVVFPDIPDFDSALQNVKPNKDGLYTTWSAVFNQDKLIDKEIRVKGEIVEVSEDCPEITRPKKKAQTSKKKKGKKQEEPEVAPVEETNKPKCTSVYVVIKSPKDQNYPLLITNYHPYYHPHLSVGMELDVTGKYVLHGNGFIRAKNGLLIISEIHTPMGVDKTGHFTTDRSEIWDMQSKGTLLTIRYKQKEETQETSL